MKHDHLSAAFLALTPCVTQAATPRHRAARAMTVALLAFSASTFAQSTNFSSLPCPQRVTALLDFWVNEKQKPGRTPCERAHLEVTIQCDLNTTALACPDDLTTIPSKLASYESAMTRVCSDNWGLTPILPIL